MGLMGEVLSHKGEGEDSSMNGIDALKRHTKGLPWYPSTMRKARIQLSVNQDAGPHQTLTESVDSLI